MTPTLRSSSLDRVLNCPGSRILNAIVEARESGAESLEGTYLHWLAHDRMKKELGAVGELGPQPKATPGIAFSHWIADFYFAVVKDKVPPQWSIEVEAALAYELAFGEPVPVPNHDPNGWGSTTLAHAFTLSGHIDALAMSPDGTEAIGFDLKSGYDPVDIAEYNWQILAYIVLLLEAYPTLKKVTFYIVQPRNDEDEGFERVSSVSREATPALRETLIAHVAESLRNSLELKAGKQQCNWCAAAIQCPEAKAKRQETQMKLTPEHIAAIKAVPDDKTLADWVIASRILSRPMDDAASLAKERIRQNGLLNGSDGTRITVKTSAGSYSFPDPVAFYRKTRELLPDDAAYAATVKPSVTKTKEAIAKAFDVPKTSKKGDSAEAIFDGALRPLCEQGTKETFVFTT